MWERNLVGVCDKGHVRLCRLEEGGSAAAEYVRVWFASDRWGPKRSSWGDGWWAIRFFTSPIEHFECHFVAWQQKFDEMAVVCANMQLSGFSIGLRYCAFRSFRILNLFCRDWDLRCVRFYLLHMLYIRIFLMFIWCKESGYLPLYF